MDGAAPREPHLRGAEDRGRCVGEWGECHVRDPRRSVRLEPDKICSAHDEPQAAGRVSLPAARIPGDCI